MANTCRISFISMVILLLFINQSVLSSSARIRLIEGRVLVNEKQHDHPTYDETVKADRARLDYLFARMIEAETNLLEVDSRPLSTMDLITNNRGKPTFQNVGTQDTLCVEWQFSGSNAAEEAAAASLGTYSSAVFALCDPLGKPILPPRSESPETSHTAEKAVVKAVICGTGNAYAPSIGLPLARRAVAEYLNRDLHNKLTGDDVFMTVGCKQAIELVVDILAKPKANILLPKPGFPADYARSIYKHVEVRRYDFIPEKDFEIDLDSVKEMADENTFAIFIINPHNPIGNYYTEAHLKQLAMLARELGIMVVSDEVYRWTVFGSNPFVPMGKFSSIVPVITLGSISKGWSVPGWRTGWLALHDLDGAFTSTKVLKAAKEFLEINSKPATVIQAAIPTILEKTPKEFFDRRQSFLKEKVDFAYSKLKDIPTLTCYMKPVACTFLWTGLDPLHFFDIEDDQDFCNKLAKEENLVLLPGIAFGQKNWLRHSIDMEIPTLEDAFKRLKSFCERHINITEA